MVADEVEPAILRLTVSPVAKLGGNIEVTIGGSNVPETVVKLGVPDTVVTSQPHIELVGSGTFERTISRTVMHVQEGSSSCVEITASAGELRQCGLCIIVS
jgi:hypothetical protein